MTNKVNLFSNKIFGVIAIGTGVVLSVPLIMMQISDDWNWDLFDFIVMGMLLFTMASLFVLITRKVRTKSLRITVGALVVLLTLYIWAELAVGIFTNLAS